MIKNWKKLISLLVFLLYFSFITSSFSLLTYTITKDNSYYVLIPQQTTKANYNIPIGHYLPFNCSNQLIGSFPNNFAGSSVGLHCKLFIDNAFTYPEKAFRYYDVGGSHQILSWKGLLNQSSYSGCIDFICYINTTMIESQNIMITLYNSSLFNGRIFDIWIGSPTQNTLKIRINYVDHGLAHQKTYYFLNEPVIYLSVNWNFLYNQQNIVGLFQNLSIAFDYTCNLDMVWNDNLYSSSQWLKIWTTTIDFCDVMFLGFDSSVYSGFYRYRCFNFTVLTKYGYYSYISYNIPLLSIIHNYLNSRIYSGNITYSVYSNSQDYTWIDAPYGQILLKNTSFYSISELNKTDLPIMLSYFDISDGNSQIIKIRVQLTINYDFIDDSLFQLYLSASIPIVLIALLPLFGYKLSKKNELVYWFSMFITVLTITIWRGIFLTLGGVIAVIAILIILIIKDREKK